MIPSVQPTHELIQACVPTRDEKRKMARLLSRGESSIYKWCEDPDGSGRANPLDYLEIFLDHARLYHPAAAFAIAARIVAGNARVIGGAASSLPPAELLAEIQEGAEKETHEALASVSAAIRRLLLGSTADLPTVLQEIDEAVHELERARVMVEAVIHEQENPE